jgi:hypothetical protein
MVKKVGLQGDSTASANLQLQKNKQITAHYRMRVVDQLLLSCANQIHLSAV